MITATKNHIIFDFLDNVVGGRFMGSVDSDIIIPSSAQQHIADESTHTSRYATILSKGPDCSDEIAVGDIVLIEKLMWSEGFEMDSETVWRTDETKLLAVAC